MWEIIPQGPKGVVKTVRCFRVERDGETRFYGLPSPIKSVRFRNTKWPRELFLSLSYSDATRAFKLGFPVEKPQELGRARMMEELTRRAGEKFALELIQLVGGGK